MIVKKNFYFDLFEKGNIHPLYKTIFLRINKNSFVQNNKNNLENFKPHSFKYFPNYLDFKISPDLKCKKIFQKHGYAANLNNCDSIENYIKKYFKSRFRNNIKRSVKRLDTCLNVNYKMFHSNINDNDYTFLMNAFHDLLKKRFEKLTVKNITLNNWDFYYKNAQHLINNKKASLFVIYNEKEPIAFSLNFHFNTVFYFAIPTFDLDYSKFTLGNIVIYKNLEWCLNNGFDIFDMGYGGFENKINWCNTTYNFEHHFIHKPKNILANLHIFILKYKYKVFNYLISKNINTKFRALISSVKKGKKQKFIDYKLIKLENDYAFNNNNLALVVYNKTTNSNLIKPVCDFIYLNKEQINHIVTYKILNESYSYLIKGKHSQVKIELTNLA